VAALVALIATPLLVVLDELAGTGSAGWLAGGVLPLAAIVAVGWGCFRLARRSGATGAEAAQAVVVLLGVAFVVLTLIGVWFRGPGMALAWPWTGGGA
jgi:hypothetical protein